MPNREQMHPEPPRFRYAIGARTALLALVALAVALTTGCGPAPRNVENTPTTIQPTVSPSVGAIVTNIAVSPTTAPASPTVPPIVTATSAPTNTATAEPTFTPTTEPTKASITAEPITSYAWTRVGLTGTNVTAMSLFAGGPNIVLAAGPKGVWTSTYDYTQWQPHTVKLGGKASSVAIGGPQNMYVTSHTGCPSGLPIADSRSTDGGATWVEIPNLGATVIVAAGGPVAYAGTCSDVQKTTDGGATWAALPNMKVPNYDPSSIAVSPDGQTVFVTFVSEGGSASVLRSVDGGSTVEDVTPKLPDGSPVQAPGELIYHTGSQGRPQDAGLYMTSYEGVWFLPSETKDWKLFKKPLAPDEDASTYTFFTALEVDANYSAEYNKPGPVVYAARARPSDTGETNLGVFRSVDLGESWYLLGKGIEGKAVHTLLLAPHDAATPGMVETLLAGTDDGIWAIPMPPPFK